MRKGYYPILLSFLMLFSLQGFSQTPPKDTNVVRVYRLDSAAIVIKDSLQKQNDLLKKQVELLKNQIEKSSDQLDSLQKKIGVSTDKIKESFTSISKKIDSLPKKVTDDNLKQSQKIIGVIPFFCDSQKFCIIRKNNTDLIDIYINGADTLPSVDSVIKKMKKFTTESRLDANNFASWLKKDFAAMDSQCPKNSDLLSLKIQEKIDRHKEKQVEDANAKILNQQRKEVDSLTQLLVDFDRLAGQLELNDSIPIYAVVLKDKNKNGTMPQVIPGTAYLTKHQKEEQLRQKGDHEKKKVAVNIDYNKYIGYLKLEKATVQIDNNRIFDISFTAVAYSPTGDKIKSLNTISNNVFSLSFKGLNNREFSRMIQPGAYAEELLKYGFGFNYGDLINYAPINSDFTPLVKNGNYDLHIDSATKIYRRRYSDYLSFRTFLDPLGFLGSNPNGFAQLEGDAVIPVNLRNYRIKTWLPHIHTNFSYIYNNTINSEKRQASTMYLANDSFSVFNPSSQTFIRKTDSASYMYNLDMIRKAYYQLYIRGALLSFEIKKQNSWLHWEFGFRVFGSKIAAKSDTSTYHKIVPEMNFNWVLRPDNIFGADLNVGIAFLGNMHRANNLPSSVNSPSFLWSSSWAVPHELNIYVQTGKESKGGLFFRYNGWFAFNKRLAKNIDERVLPNTVEINKTAYFPQILFGYSTNLSTMIKRAGQDR